METPLQLTIQGTEHSEALEKRIREKVERLEHYDPRITGCRVAIDIPQKHTHQGKIYTVRIEVTVPGHRIVVTRDRDEDVYVALRDAFDAVRRQIEDWVRKERGATKVHEPLFRGRIVRIFPEEGFGFIETEDGREIYFNRDNCVHPAFDRLDLGDDLEFLVVEGGESPQARRVVKKQDHGE